MGNIRDNTDIELLALAFDECFDNKDIDGTKKLIIEAQQMLINGENYSHLEIASIHYSLGTALGDITQNFPDALSENEKENHQENSLYHYRYAVNELAISNNLLIDNEATSLPLQLYTNIGNAYASHGRYIEALRMYEKAHEYTFFPMAMAQQGFKCLEFSLYFYDIPQSQRYCHYAYWAMGEALKNKEHLHHTEYLVEELKTTRKSISDFFGVTFLETEFNDKNYGYGKTKGEQDYKVWCTLERLFLNPMNEITTNSITAHDYIHLPDMRYRIDSKKDMFHYGLFNQIIQEFVSARYLFYDGTQFRKKAQIPDKNVHQVVIDYNVNSHADFCIRTAFKTLYSTLDRIAFFMNDYFELKLALRDISFRKIWHKNIKNIDGVKINNPLILKTTTNKMLKALYWLSKDIHEEKQRTTNPKSKKLDKLRNALEHRYVASTLSEIEFDDKELISYINTSELYNLTLDMLRIVREAIIYVSFAVHIEEKNKRKSDEQGTAVIKMYHTKMKDDWK